MVKDTDDRTQFGFFTDFRTELNAEDGDANSYSGQVVAHVTSALSERMYYFTEATLSPDGHSGGQASLERAFFKYTLNDRLRLRVGRIHTPVSLWNSTYHHGQFLQTSINRPEVVKYSTAFSPIHSVVAEVGGRLSTKTGSFSYTFGAGVSETHNHGGSEDHSAGEKNNAAYVTIGYEPNQILGLRVGLSGYVEDMPAAEHGHDAHEHAHAQHDVDRKEIISGYAQIQRYRWAAIAEFTHLAHVGSRRFTGNRGYYVQTEVDFGGALERLVLFGRYGGLTKNGHDPIFADDLCLNWNGVTSGVRINIAPTAALTLESRLFGEESVLDNHRFSVQLSAAF